MTTFILLATLLALVLSPLAYALVVRLIMWRDMRRADACARRWARGWPVIAIVLLLGGCAAMQQEREDRYMPRATTPTAVRSVFAAECDAARSTAIATRDKADIMRMVDACSAVSAISCGQWMRKDVLLAQGIVMKDSTAAAVGAATTIAAGAFSLSPGAVAGVGVAQLILHLFGQVEKQGLGIPDTYLAQAKMREALSTCSATLLDQARAGMSLAAATIGIDNCEWVCTPAAASTVATAALAQSAIAVKPSGELTVTTVSSSFQKDDSTAKIIAFWMPDGKVNAANDARLKKWMADNGITVSVPFLAHTKLYESARKQAVTDFGDTMTTRVESLTDIPSADLLDMVEAFQEADADQVLVIAQKDGKFTVTATFTSPK